jgi:hypothetical protein
MFRTFKIFHYWTISLKKQIDFGEDTGPRTVVSGLVHYIPIEEMRDKYLVGVVSRSYRHLDLLSHVIQVQPKTCKHERHQKFRDGTSCKLSLYISSCHAPHIMLGHLEGRKRRRHRIDQTTREFETG